MSEPATDGGAASAVVESPTATDPPESARAEQISTGRLVLVDAIVVLATILGIVGILAVWANRLLFSPDNWANTSTQLLANPTIRSEAANYLVDQVYANVNVAGELQSALPPRLQPLASQAAGALRGAAVKGVDAALTRPRVQDAWATANRTADKAFIAVVDGGKGPVGVNQGVVTLNLAQLVNTIASRLGLPSNLGSKLPPNVAQLTIMKSNQLKFVQDAGKATRHLAFWLTAIVPLMYLLAIALARAHRRRTLMTVGFAIIFAGLVAILGRKILDTQITSSLVKDASLRPAASATVQIGTQILREIAAAFVYVGLVVVVSAWVAGPARPARALRRAWAPSMRERPAAWYAGTLAVMTLIFIWDPIHATGTPVGIITFTVLALVGMFFLMRETVREFPDAHRGDTIRRIRAWRDKRRRNNQGAQTAAATASSPFTDQLQHLADLRDNGDLTTDEYQHAKEQLLRS
jgi:Short C-terminal domain